MAWYSATVDIIASRIEVNVPLHVRVAEALGVVICDRWMQIDFDPWNGATYRQNCQHPNCVPSQRPPRYDTDWAATGPLIERFADSLRATAYGWIADARPGLGPWDGEGETPLVAVCNLILALAAAGKLESPQEQVNR